MNRRFTIADFIPVYPDIDDKSFFQDIIDKKEFTVLAKNDTIPDQRGKPMLHQQNIARFMSSNTQYNRLLVAHETGTGKTCAIINLLEGIKNDPNSLYKKAHIFSGTPTLVANIEKGLRINCTVGQYNDNQLIEPSVHSIISDEKWRKFEHQTRRITRKLTQPFYSFKTHGKLNTFHQFAALIQKDQTLVQQFENSIIVIDEAHLFPYVDHKKTFTQLDRKVKLYTYNLFHKFLHEVKHCKILLFTATPMYNKTDEIALLMNLLLPLNKQLNSKTFMHDFFEKKKGKYVALIDSKRDILKTRFRGLVSVLKSQTSKIPRVFIRDTSDTTYKNSLQYIKAYSSVMHAHQTLGYMRAYDLDVFLKYTKGNQDIKTLVSKMSADVDIGTSENLYTNALEASLFVYPDGSWGTAGYNRYIKKIPYTIPVIPYDVYRKQNGDLHDEFSSREMWDKLSDHDKEKYYKLATQHRSVTQSDTLDLKTCMFIDPDSEYDDILENVRIFSVKYYTIIKNILDHPNELMYVYTQSVKGSGIIVLETILAWFGLEKVTSKNMDYSNKNKKRFIVLSGDTTPADRGILVERFNSASNSLGKYAQVIIGSSVSKTGISLHGIQHQHILSPWFNYSQIEQALGRGHRENSHVKLLKELGKQKMNTNISVHNYLHIAHPVLDEKNRKISYSSVDELLYLLAEDKDFTNKLIMRLLMEVSFDCQLNKARNTKSIENSRECDYTTCNYTCTGISDMNATPSKDVSTHQLLYFKPYKSEFHIELEQLFQRYNSLHINEIVTYFQGSYTKTEIVRSVELVLRESKSKHVGKKRYNQIYNATSLDYNNLVSVIRSIFQQHVKHGLGALYNYTSTHYNTTMIELLNVLSHLMESNSIMYDRYGGDCYLREHDDNWFLSNNVSIDAHESISQYIKYPFVLHPVSYTSLVESILNSEIQTLLNMATRNINNREQLLSILGLMSVHHVELLLEQLLTKKKLNHVGQTILYIYEGHIYRTGNQIISTLLKDDINGDVRVYENKKWRSDIKALAIVQQLVDAKINSIDKKVPYHGLINRRKYDKSTTETFCLYNRKVITTKTQKGKISKSSKLRGKACTSHTLSKGNRKKKADDLANIYTKITGKIPEVNDVGTMCNNLLKEMKEKNLVVHDVTCGQMTANRTKMLVEKSYKIKGMTHIAFAGKDIKLKQAFIKEWKPILKQNNIDMTEEEERDVYILKKRTKRKAAISPPIGMVIITHPREGLSDGKSIYVDLLWVQSMHRDKFKYTVALMIQQLRKMRKKPTAKIYIKLKMLAVDYNIKMDLYTQNYGFKVSEVNMKKKHVVLYI